jgi:hypothetical protein
VGTEFTNEGETDPIFETDDDIDSIMDQVGGWAYVMDEADAQLGNGGYVEPSYIVSVAHLGQMADACEVLAEQYGDENRTFLYNRPAAVGDDPSHTRPLTVTGPELAHVLRDLARTVREASALGRSLRIDRDE